MVGEVIPLMPRLLRDEQALIGLQLDILTIVALLDHRPLKNIVHLIAGMDVDRLE